MGISMEILEETGYGLDDVTLLPRSSKLRSRKDPKTETVLIGSYTISSPLMAANMEFSDWVLAASLARCGAVGIIHRFMTIEEEAQQVRNVKDTPISSTDHHELGYVDPKFGFSPSVDENGKLLVGATIGVNGDTMKRAEALLAAGANFLALEVAHAENPDVHRQMEMLKRDFPKALLMVGNVATGHSVTLLIQYGADAVKIGVGPGSACATRMMTGVGVPQFTAVVWGVKASNEAPEYTAKATVPIIADGGIKNPGHVAKLLAAGASSVMIGGLYAGTAEANSELVWTDKGWFKSYRGLSSSESNYIGSQVNGKAFDHDLVVAEGGVLRSPYYGTVAQLTYQMVGGVRSGMTYVGAHNLGEMHERALFMPLSAGAVKESYERPFDPLEHRVPEEWIKAAHRDRGLLAVREGESQRNGHAVTGRKVVRA